MTNMANASDFQDNYEFKKELSFFNGKPRLFEIRKAKIQKKWMKDEDKLLIELARKYNSRSWKTIASHFIDKTPLQCFSRYKRIRPGIVKGSWTKEEDQQIMELVGKYGKSWSKISKILVSRNGKQIRDRYINILDPSIKKGKFSLDEDLKLLTLYKKLGPRWATIAKFFENRTADMVKNRFHSSIKKNMKFLEDVEYDYSYPAYKQECSTGHEEISKMDSYGEEPTNFINFMPDQSDISISGSQYIEEESQFSRRKDFEILKEENIINLNFLQTSENTLPSWQLEDYFIL
jgi:hypothetical protein